jgi:homoserine acetyltransferase
MAVVLVFFLAHVRQVEERAKGTRHWIGKVVGPGLEIAADVFCVLCVPT